MLCLVVQKEWEEKKRIFGIVSATTTCFNVFMSHILWFQAIKWSISLKGEEKIYR